MIFVNGRRAFRKEVKRGIGKTYDDPGNSSDASHITRHAETVDVPKARAVG